MALHSALGRTEKSLFLIQFMSGNILLLRKQLRLDSEMSEISEENLIECIANRLLDSFQNKSASNVENEKQNIMDMLNLLPNFATGIDVNPKFRELKCHPKRTKSQQRQKPTKTPVKEPSSSEESSSDAEPVVPAKKLPVPVSKNGTLTKKAKPASSSESDSDEEEGAFTTNNIKSTSQNKVTAEIYVPQQLIT